MIQRGITSSSADHHRAKQLYVKSWTTVITNCSDFLPGHADENYPLANVYIPNWKIDIEIMDFHIENGDFL